MQPTSPNKIQDLILKKHGVIGIRDRVKSQQRLKKVTNVISIGKKTHTMELLELKYGLDIVSILTSGSLNHIARTYLIDKSTASKWRKRLREEILKFIQLNPETILPPDTTTFEGET